MLGPTTLRLEVATVKAAKAAAATVTLTGPRGDDPRTLTVAAGEPRSGEAELGAPAARTFAVDAVPLPDPQLEQRIHQP